MVFYPVAPDAPRERKARNIPTISDAANQRIKHRIQYMVSYDTRTGDFVVIDVQRVERIGNGLSIFRNITNSGTFTTHDDRVYSSKADAQVKADADNQ